MVKITPQNSKWRIDIMTTYKFSVLIPDLLDGKIDFSEPYVNYSARGKPTSYEMDLTFDELQLRKSCRSRDVHLLSAKIDDTLLSWEARYTRHLDALTKERTAQSVDEDNEAAVAALDALHSILAHTLTIDDTVDWRRLERRDKFVINLEELIQDERSRSKMGFNSLESSRNTLTSKLHREPALKDVQMLFGMFANIFQRSEIRETYEQLVAEWDTKSAEFYEQQKQDNAAIQQMKDRYLSSEPSAIEEYCDLVLQNSEYPDNFPKSWELEYRQDSNILIVDYHLPDIEHLPITESYRYIKSRNEVVTKNLSEAAMKKLYESVIYQICIRTLHELIEADAIDAIHAVAFNGLVTRVNPAIGADETKIILSVLADKTEFSTFDLSRVDPKATFKHLKGISGVALIDLTPVAPIIALEKTDRRFVEGHDVVYALDSSVNLAAMDWEDFEHLVRELFEEEFASKGGEVKVTRASADGGVDAIAFDPDPIRGGKIVIQAKRYTNVVSVAAVRDLYGTVVNEGATKGILVTTSNYGKDSYDFAKDKPLTLLNGQNLLHLLGKHGHKARINIAEAKKVLNLQ